MIPTHGKNKAARAVTDTFIEFMERKRRMPWPYASAAWTLRCVRREKIAKSIYETMT